MPHLAVIPDGNRRYAQKSGSDSSSMGGSLHAFRELIDWCSATGDVSHLSVFCWSSENWSREEAEVDAAMRHLHEYLTSIIVDTTEIRHVCCSSSPDSLPPAILGEMYRINSHHFAAEEIKEQTTPPLYVYLYISYGFAEFMTEFTNNNSYDNNDGDSVLRLQRIDRHIPHIDCLVRTSGEQRLSNFCMHKLSFAELIFVEQLFPECTSKTWQDCMKEFAHRSRRFGQ